MIKRCRSSLRLMIKDASKPAVPKGGAANPKRKAKKAKGTPPPKSTKKGKNGDGKGTKGKTPKAKAKGKKAPTATKSLQLENGDLTPVEAEGPASKKRRKPNQRKQS